MKRFQPLLQVLILVNTILITALIIFVFTGKTQNVAVVRTGAVLEKFIGMQEAQQLISKEESKYTGRLDTLQVLYNRARYEYDQNKSRLSQKQLLAAEELISKREQDFNTYQQVAQEKMKEISDKITQGVLNQINDAVKVYAEKKHIDLVIGVNLTGNVLYGNPKLDITDDLIEILNAGQ